MNLELTTACPFRCPQCYCSMENVKHLALDTAKKALAEGAALGLQSVSLSGGETMCYPHLLEVISYAKKECGIPGVHAAFSGWRLTESVVTQLLEAGLDSISISLNGSTEAVNSLTRQGYADAIRALTLLRDMGYEHTTVNWVMHSNNVDDFDDLVSLCASFNVELLDVISFKPDAKAQLKSVPSQEQLLTVAKKIKNQSGKPTIYVERCYSQLLALVADTKLFGNFNRGKFRGCTAGYDAVSVNVDGSYSPCRHIHYKENYGSIREYMEQSPVIRALAACDETVAEEPCKSCRFLLNCRPCIGVNTEIDDRIAFKNAYCHVNG